MIIPNVNFCAVSSYNEGTEYQQDFYIHEYSQDGDGAWVYSHETKEFKPLIIHAIISRNEDPVFYDELINKADILRRGESIYSADESAEFITDKNSYLVWFRYMN